MREGGPPYLLKETMYKALFLLLLLGVLYREYRRGSLREVLSAVFNFRGIVIACLSLSLLSIDGSVYIKLMSGAFTLLSKVGNIIGDADVVIPILVSAFYVVYLSRFREVEKAVGEIICLVILSTLFGDLVKILLGRARPYMMEGPYSFFNFPESVFNNDFQSFPSGHVMVASTLFGYFSARFGGFFRILYPIAVSIVAYNRLETRNHFLSDIAFSAVFGYLVVHRCLKGVGE